jgi:hypothetical protein
MTSIKNRKKLNLPARLFLFIGLILFLQSCSNNFTVKNFKPITNFGGADSIKNLDLDFKDAFLNGFVIPSVAQAEGGKFKFSFDIQNNSGDPQEFFYKIYYQNESYKFNDTLKTATSNFYGSWEDTGIEFKSTGKIEDDGEFHNVTDAIQIVGNPRNEKIFFGTDEEIPFSAEELAGKMNEIKNTPDWYKSIQDKAFKDKKPVDVQLRMDAVYVIRENKRKDVTNHRWKRNPRCGEYSFLLVVADQKTLDSIPSYIKNISTAGPYGNYMNPYGFFLNNSFLKKNKEIFIEKKTCLKVAAKFPLEKGIYSNPRNFDMTAYKTTSFNPTCNESEQMMQQAAIEQFIHVLDNNNKFENVPAKADVNSVTFTKWMYENANMKNPVRTPIATTDCPCKTVQLDPNGKKVLMYNPASEGNNFKKENVGIITRTGFTYGKFRAKVKLSQLLNKNQVWNGLTNAIWLYAMKGEWNQRSSCKNGFIPKGQSGPDAKKISSTFYSEIDIEIVKSARGWPKTSYINSSFKKPEEPISDSDKVFVTATNWDMACRDAKKFDRGAFTVKHGNTDYVMHRWDDWYQAVTSKYPAADDELFASDYYWFEIEWRPNEIIWRMGPEKDKLREFAWMDNTFTNIPDNQMQFVITQEYHLVNWWPEAPFDQNKIPFPEKNIYGEILAIEVE